MVFPWETPGRLPETNAAGNHDQNTMTKTILAIDDNQDFLDLLKILLEDSGYRVLLADSAAKAMESMETEPPDAVILDLMMPQRNGFEFLENLRWDTRFEKLPVIVLTAMTLTGEEREFLEAFTVACMDKAQSTQVVDRLKQLLPDS